MKISRPAIAVVENTDHEKKHCDGNFKRKVNAFIGYTSNDIVCVCVCVCVCSSKPCLMRY